MHLKLQLYSCASFDQTNFVIVFHWSQALIDFLLYLRWAKEIWEICLQFQAQVTYLPWKRMGIYENKQLKYKCCCVVNSTSKFIHICNTSPFLKSTWKRGQVERKVSGKKTVLLSPASMPHSCFAYGCSNISGRENTKGKSFHNVPLTKPALLAEWMKQLNKHRGNNTPVRLNKYSRICSDHFDPECFERNGLAGRWRLKTNAVPTRFGAKTSPRGNSAERDGSIKPSRGTTKNPNGSKPSTQVSVRQSSYCPRTN